MTDSGPPRVSPADWARPSGGSGERHGELFDECPVSLWEGDLSAPLTHLDHLRASGVVDLRAHLAEHPEELVRCAKLIRGIAVNRAAVALYEAPDEHSLLAALGEVSTEESFATFREAVVALSEGKRHFEAETVSRTLRGRVLFVDLRWSLLPDDQGEPTRVLLSVVDLTERKRREEALREDEERFKALIENTSDWIWEIDEDGRYTYASPKTQDLLGYEPWEVIGKTPFDFMPPEEARRVAQLFRELIQARKPLVGLTNVNVRRDGRSVVLETSGVPILDVEGRFRGYRGIDRDVTERQLLEEERVKTQRLESVGKLAGGIAHDFNNLLQGVFGYISLAKVSLDPSDRPFVLLEQAEKALHITVNLTSRLLTFAKGGEPVKARLALGPVIENAARFALSGSCSGFQLDVAPGLWDADADEAQIVQVVQNLVLNADQSMPSGGRVTITARNLPAVEAAARAGLERRDYVEVAVADEGVGIPEQDLGRIFDPYFTTKENGSGLGLATSYSIVRNHDGRIEVRSQAGAGSTFVVLLPAVTSQAVTTEEPAPPASAPSARILLMDDEELVREVAGDLLQVLGHEVEFAEHGEAALRTYREARQAGRPFDLVILDLTIRGGLGGEETLRRLLEIDPEVRAVVSSGYSDDGIIAAYQLHGFRAFLKKPYRLEELRRTLDALLS